MKEIIRDLRTGKRIVNWNLIVELIVFAISVVVMIHDTICILKGMSFTTFGFTTSILAFAFGELSLQEIIQECK